MDDFVTDFSDCLGKWVDMASYLTVRDLGIDTSTVVYEVFTPPLIEGKAEQLPWREDRMGYSSFEIGVEQQAGVSNGESSNNGDWLHQKVSCAKQKKNRGSQ